jgi:hypothetical protein
MRFTIRELVLLTVIVALSCAWVLEHRRAQYWAKVKAVYAQEVQIPETSFDEWLKWRQSAHFRELFGDIPETVPLNQPE